MPTATRSPCVLAALLLSAVAVAEPAEAGRGGPDAWSYTWYDVAEGCAVEDDPATLANVGSFSGNFVGPFDIGFDFPFYDRLVRQVWLNRSGLVFLAAPDNLAHATNGPLPEVGGPAAFIAPYWDALEWYRAPSYGYESFPAQGVFKLFMDLRPMGTASPITFEVYLYENGDIRIEYLAEPGPPYGSTIGIESFAEDMGLEVFRDGTSPGGFTMLNAVPHALCIVRQPLLDCGPAISVACGDTFSTSSPPSVARNASRYTCDPSTWLGNEVVLEVALDELSDLTVALGSAGTRVLGAFILDECDELDCLAGGGAVATASTLPPGTYSIVVDGLGPTDDGNVRGSVDCAPLSTRMTCGESLRATTAGGPNRIADYTRLPGIDASGTEAWFSVDFAPPGNLNVSLDTTQVVAIYDTSGVPAPGTALAAGLGGAVLYSPPAGRYLVVVDGAPAEVGPFTISVSCVPEVPCVPGAGSLGCNANLSGSTVGGVSYSDFYRCTSARFAGPEAVYTITNPTRQVVSIVLDDSREPLLDLFILSACDEKDCVKYGDKEVSVDLPPGTYHVVVDSPGPAADFSLSTVCGNSLEPAVLTVIGAAGDCFNEHKTTWLTPEIDQVDVLFAIDLTTSMVGARRQLQQNMQDIIVELQRFIRDVEFGLVSLRDYPYAGAYSVPCPYSSLAGSYGAPTDYAYRLHQPITADIGAMQLAVDGLPPAAQGADLPESYTRVLWETYNDPAIAWRAGSRRVVVTFGDDLPHDCNVLQCLGGTAMGSRGIDLGRDNTPNTADDLRILDVIDGLVANSTMLIHLDNSTASLQGSTYKEIWDCWAAMTGGVAERINPDGTVPPQIHPDGLAGLIGELLQERGFLCDTLVLQASAGYEGWLASVTPTYTNVPLPSVRDFDIEVCVPPGTPDGEYGFEVQALCSGEIVATQRIIVTVTGSCAPSVIYLPSDVSLCAGASAILDASGMDIVNCGVPLEYSWTNGTDTYPDPLIFVTPADSEAWTVDVTCPAVAGCGIQATAKIDVHHAPDFSVAAAADPSACNLGIEVTWEPAVFRDPLASGTYSVYRSEVDCADALTRAPLVRGLTDLRWVDPLTRDGRTYHYVVEAEDARTATPCVPRGPNNGGVVRRVCVAAVAEQGVSVGTVPEGVFDTLRMSHARVGGDVVGHEVTAHWETARALLPGEHFHLLKAADDPQAPFAAVNPEADLSLSHTEDDRSSRLQFFDLRVASDCEILSADEYPPGF